MCIRDRDKHGKDIYEPYRIKVLNTIKFKKSMHYNPFTYIHSVLCIRDSNYAAQKPEQF